MWSDSHLLHQPQAQDEDPVVPPMLDLLAGSAAGATAVLVTYPLDLVRTRLAFGLDASGSVPATPATSAGKVPSSGTKTPLANLRRSCSSGPATAIVNDQSGAKTGSKSGSWDIGRGPLARGLEQRRASGSQAGPASASASQSDGAAERTSRAGGGRSTGTGAMRATIRSMLASTLQREGIGGLYRGLGPTMAGILPYAGLKFYVYQSLKAEYRCIRLMI